MSSTLMQQPRLIPVQSIQAKPRWQLDPSLVLYLPLWNISGDTFLSQDAYGHTVTRYGATATGQGGMSFDGVDDYLDAGASPKGATELTCGGWICLPSLQAGERIVIFKNNDYAVDIFPADGKMRSLLATDGITGWTGTHDLSFTWEVNRWYFLATTYDGGNGRDYVNGQSQNTYTATGKLAANAGIVGIGGNPAAGLWLSGRIGEVSIFNRALSALEIQNLYELTRGRYGG